MDAKCPICLGIGWVITVTFPRYEIGEPETFDELLTTIDQDVWNLGGYHPTWKLGVNWPQLT